MGTIIIHAEGQPCPAPVVKAARALEELQEPGTVEIYVDNVAAVQNLQRLAGGKGLAAQAEQTGEKQFRVLLDVPAPLSNQPLREPSAVVLSPAAAVMLPTNGTVVTVDGETMGRGDEALGRTLLKGFLFALSRLPAPPETILFYNGGAKLTAAGSESLEDLRDMEARGTQIWTCGTCLQHYGLPNPPAVGGVTNLYDIAERLTAAGKVVKP